MRSMRLLAVLAALAAPVFAASPRLAFDRYVPAPYSLGDAENAVVLYALGDSDKLETFLTALVDDTAQASLRIDDATRSRQRFVTGDVTPDAIRELHRRHPADAYLGVKAFTCNSKVNEGEGSVHDADGKRVRQHVVWVEAICEARMDALDANDLHKRHSFRIVGEGKSSRVPELTRELRDAALEQAARRAALHAAENITPRRVRESIALDDTAPLFDEGMAMIEAGRLADARNIWMRGLRQYADSAALHFNVAAASEATGDLDAARRHLAEARRLAPEEVRYRRVIR